MAKKTDEEKEDYDSSAPARSAGVRTPFADGSDVQANLLHQYIEFFHIPSGQRVRFKAFLRNFSDQYTSNWNKEEVFGRMDPVQTFKNTTREISVAWDVPSASIEEARRNLRKCTKLFSMLYPSYNSGGLMAGAPLFKMRIMNLAQDVSAAGRAGSAAQSGLVGSVSGFNYTPDLDSGFFHARAGKVYPQTISLECTYSVMHTHELGWSSTGTKLTREFPYNEPAARPRATGAPTPPSNTGDRQNLSVGEQADQEEIEQQMTEGGNGFGGPGGSE